MIYAIQTECDFTICRAVSIVFATLFVVIGLLRVFTEFGKQYILFLILHGLGDLVLTIYVVRKFDTIKFEGNGNGRSVDRLSTSDDIQMVMSGKRRSKITSEEYVLGAILLYLDTVLVFIYLFKILSDCDCDE